MSKSREILEVFKKRYACKKYDKNRAVSDEDFSTIIESAQLSPSSFGLEPWKFVLVRNEKVREDMREFAWGAINSIDGASHIVMVLAKKGITAESSDFENTYRNIKKVPDDIFEMTKDKFSKFQEEHLKLLESERSLFDWASKQTYIALGNMMTVAAYLGIDSCSIEGFNKEQAEKYFSEKGIFDLDEYGISYFVSFGYRGQEITPKTRKELSEIYSVVE